MASGERINVAPLAKNARAVGDPIFDNAVVDTHPVAAKRWLPIRHSCRIHVFGEKVEVSCQRVAIAVLYREKGLRIAPEVVRHHVETNRAGKGIVERCIRPKDVLEKKVVVVLRLRRVGE